MSTETTTENICHHCGAVGSRKTQFASGFVEYFACGSTSHSDGFDQSIKCKEGEAARKAEKAATMTPDPELDAALEMGRQALEEDAKKAKVLPALLDVSATTIPAELAGLDKIRAEIEADLKASALISPTACLDDKKTAKDKVHELRMRLKNRRLALTDGKDSTGKKWAAWFDNAKRFVGSKLSELVALQQAEEDRLQGIEDAIDASIAADKAAIEEARRAKVQARADQLASLGAPANLQACEKATDAEWVALIAEATTAKEERDRLAAEAEAERLRIEEEAKAKAEAERQEREAAEKAERERLAAENARIEAERVRQEEERQKLEAERAELRRQQEAAQAEIDRQNAEIEKAREEIRSAEAAKARAEQARLDAIEKAAREAREAAEREEVEKTRAADEKVAETARLARIEAERPDRDKIAAWCEAVKSAIPDLPIIISHDLHLSVAIAREDILNRINIIAAEIKENAE